MRAILAMLILIVSTAVLEAQAPGPDTAFVRRFDEIAASRGRVADSVRLHRLLRANWEYTMHEYPEFATFVGYPGQDHRLGDVSFAAIERRRRELTPQLRALRSIERGRLGAADQLNYDLLLRGFEESQRGQRFPGELMPITQLGGVQQDVAQLLAVMRITSVRDAENVLARLRLVPRLVDQTIALLDSGAVLGVTPPRITLRDVPGQIRAQIPAEPLESPLLQTFADLPSDIPSAERTRLRADAERLYRDQVQPAYERLHAFFVERYLPRARETLAATALPDGPAWYAFSARSYTTTELSPREIHDIGLAEVRRIRGEMDRVITSAGFTGSFGEFLTFLRTDPQFYHTDTAAFMREYRDIAKRIDPELVKLFGTLPRLPYGVRAVPAYAERSQTTAYYLPGSLEAGRPGWFYANTYDLASRPRWEMEALTVHEAVPGHHLQIALAQELEDVPDFRRHGGFTAFVEGWGLYSESLGGELGLYRDPYSRFGQLTYEMWRAVRLVVDTGIHAFGWTRDQAIAYFLGNSSKSEHDVIVEVDRYISWPGQALAYKIGELRIRELREYATAQLGPAFDIRAFHDELLGAGALPLDVLEARMRAWVQERRGRAED
jgi:uncharacterized protein (DUF885 family)